MAVQRNASGGKKRAAEKMRRKRRLRPPWRNLIGGKPIERQYFYFDEKHDVDEQHVRLIQHIRMLQLIDHYKIQGAVEAYPIKGFAPATWLPWYELALAIAKELDNSLKIVDAVPRKRTSRRWRGGAEGAKLIELVDAWKKARPGKSVSWYLEQVRKLNPNGYGRMKLPQLRVRYSEAKKYHEITKVVRNKGRAL